VKSHIYLKKYVYKHSGFRVGKEKEWCLLKELNKHKSLKKCVGMCHYKFFFHRLQAYQRKTKIFFVSEEKKFIGSATGKLELI
jgi:hypothetical protein